MFVCVCSCVYVCVLVQAQSRARFVRTSFVRLKLIMQVINADDLAWVGRVEKRTAAVIAYKESDEYKGSSWRGHTPNPTDRTMSKREWERIVMDWRNDVRNTQEVVEVAHERCNDAWEGDRSRGDGSSGAWDDGDRSRGDGSSRYDTWAGWAYVPRSP